MASQCPNFLLNHLAVLTFFRYRKRGEANWISFLPPFLMTRFWTLCNFRSKRGVFLQPVCLVWSFIFFSQPTKEVGWVFCPLVIPQHVLSKIFFSLFLLHQTWRETPKRPKKNLKRAKMTSSRFFIAANLANYLTSLKEIDPEFGIVIVTRWKINHLSEFFPLPLSWSSKKKEKSWTASEKRASNFECVVNEGPLKEKNPCLKRWWLHEEE